MQLCDAGAAATATFFDSQVANYLEFSAEDKEDERKRALGEVVAVGDDVWVKVGDWGGFLAGQKVDSFFMSLCCTHNTTAGDANEHHQ